MPIVSEKKYQFSETEAHLAASVNNSLNGILTVNEAGQIFLFNSTAEKLFGYSASEATQKNIKDLAPELFEDIKHNQIKSFWRFQQKIKMGSFVKAKAYCRDGILQRPICF